MRSTLVLTGKLAVFLLGGYLSGRYEDGYWRVGPIFGLVVVVWQAASLRTMVILRSGAFLAAATVAYALANWMVSTAFFKMIEAEFSRAGPAGLWQVAGYAAMFVGTALLPIAHAVCFKASWKRVLVAIPGIYGLWILLGTLINALGVDDTRLAPLIHATSIWQGLYLLFMFGRVPRFLRRKAGR